MPINDLLILKRPPSQIGRIRRFVLRSLLIALAATFAPDNATAADNAIAKERLKIVFEINSGTDVAFEMFVANMEGLLRNFSNLADIAVVATSRGTGLFRNGNNRFETRLAKLADHGIDFMVCSDGLKELEFETADLLGFARTVPSGGTEVENLKEQGWAHVGDGESYVSHF